MVDGAWPPVYLSTYLPSAIDENKGDEINNDDLAHAKHLKVNETGDNEDIRRMVVKSVIDPLINTEGFGQDMDKLQAYIDLIPQEEISEDIEKMYNFITENL